ncbi:MAG TPA: YetF domain-containing protein [Candidatus Polarisedimenticolia bacterium]|nr:YetF domain-containing protein [Candidatus Polarisedimenticolia bacterium]
MPMTDFGSSLLDVAIRTAIVYVFIVIALKVGGQRDVGQMSRLDLIVLLVIADAVQNAMVGENTSLLGGLVAATVLVGLDRGLRYLEQRSKRVERIIEGEARMLIRNGVVLGKAMREEDISTDELMAALRQHGVLRPDEVELAVLETDGSISVVPSSGGSD